MKRSVEIDCKVCGNKQRTLTNARCDREKTCSRCLQKQWKSGKIAYWG